MDVFFKWCSACNLNYSEAKYKDEDRRRLAEIWWDHPGWVLEQVMAEFCRF